ncbi:MAG TPA: ribosome small subunit-dependent GTPase A [Acidobacteriota bacterium]|nr:ribosome small subunit-dependent GTPase A [Acidobacteriota bacterium]
MSQLQQHRLESYGWDSAFQQSFQEHQQEGVVPGRVVSEKRGGLTVLCREGEFPARIAGRLRHHADDRSQLAAVGDWVALRLHQPMGRIEAVLPRRSQFIRKSAGRRSEGQVVGANIDTVFLVSALNEDFNLRRLERYLVLAWESGADPIVLLNKSDLCPEPQRFVAESEEVAMGVPVYLLSALEGQGLEPLQQYLEHGRTVALLGSSGVGKSTLVNALAGAALQATAEIRQEDGRGRHTTTHRQLLLLPRGGLLLDTPGMRELQLWDSREGLNETFEDILELARECRFRDCAHDQEPGCAVRQSLRRGEIDVQRLESYRRLLREQRYQATRQDESLKLKEKQRVKKLHKKYRKIIAHRRKR